MNSFRLSRLHILEGKKMIKSAREGSGFKKLTHARVLTIRSLMDVSNDCNAVYAKDMSSLFTSRNRELNLRIHQAFENSMVNFNPVPVCEWSLSSIRIFPL